MESENVYAEYMENDARSSSYTYDTHGLRRNNKEPTIIDATPDETFSKIDRVEIELCSDLSVNEYMQKSILRIDDSSIRKNDEIVKIFDNSSAVSAIFDSTTDCTKDRYRDRNLNSLDISCQLHEEGELIAHINNLSISSCSGKKNGVIDERNQMCMKLDETNMHQCMQDARDGYKNCTSKTIESELKCPPVSGKIYNSPRSHEYRKNFPINTSKSYSKYKAEDLKSNPSTKLTRGIFSEECKNTRDSLSPKKRKVGTSPSSRRVRMRQHALIADDSYTLVTMLFV